MDSEDIKKLLAGYPECISIAAARYMECRTLGNLDLLLCGLLEHHGRCNISSLESVESDRLLLIEDLGLDSFCVVELAYVFESALNVSLNEHELANLRTVGDVRALVHANAGLNT